MNTKLKEWIPESVRRVLKNMCTASEARITESLNTTKQTTSRCVPSAWRRRRSDSLIPGDHRVKPASSHVLSELTRTRGRPHSFRRQRSQGLASSPACLACTSCILPSCRRSRGEGEGCFHLRSEANTSPLLTGCSLKFIPASHLLLGLTTLHPEGEKHRAARGPTVPLRRHVSM